ncbi:histidine kinase [Campylobacter troglodytis]|uniref:histidine kinase n=1 Tax=Campylobacter troglodytis TaxID=654363 RepID=UPI00115A1D1E|nr:histidine kinase [Campylobacter troglodytis]TQR61457.1 histidine kinase [Campylobacter troglodytis]
MSSQDYKKIALNYFRKKDFEKAKLYLSLAYEKKAHKNLLNLIELCDFAINSPDEAGLLFEFYMKNCKARSINDEFEKILELSEKKRSFQQDFEDEALNYRDFLESEKELGFKKSFENIIFANKLIINNKSDFLDFLEKLLDNGYKDLMLNYLENVAGHFAGDEHFMRLQAKLRGF